jgi:demethylmacrocin O-methyltransferase
MSTDSALIENILVAACLPDAEISARVADVGSGIVSEAILAELAGRAALLSGPVDEVAIQCDLGFRGERLGYILTLGDRRARVETGWHEGAAATVRQELVDLLYELFGPPGPHGATRELFKENPSVGQRTPEDTAVVAAISQVLGAVSQRPKSLSELAVLFGSDKWGGHWYTPYYQRYFEPYRELAVKVLEIGVGGYNSPNLGGESLRMWKHYFRRGLIYGLDIFEKPHLAESRLHVLQGDQGDERFLDSMASRIGPFDIVIDDGSHFSHHVITSFNALFPHVRPGGLYVIEDLQTSYWPGWGGNADPSAQGTSMAMIKSLLDGLNHQEQMRESDHKPSTAELTVTGVHVHHNLAFIEKGLNTEQGAPASVPRTGQQPSRVYANK